MGGHWAPMVRARRAQGTLAPHGCVSLAWRAPTPHCGRSSPNGAPPRGVCDSTAMWAWQSAGGVMGGHWAPMVRARCDVERVRLCVLVCLCARAT